MDPDLDPNQAKALDPDTAIFFINTKDAKKT
jgi:hypothetical protein